MKEPIWVVKEVQPREDYSLLLTFADGSRKVYNARPLLAKKTYASLNNIAFFMGAKAAYGTVIWDEDIDIAPENLYAHSQPLGNMPHA